MSVANAYARALLMAAKERTEAAAQFEQYEAQLDQFIASISSSKEMSVALYGPIVAGREKVLLVREICKKSQFAPLLTEFLALLAKKNRLSIIQEIRAAFTEIRVEQEGGMTGHLSAAEQMSETDVAALAQAFSKKIGKKVAFRVSTDPTLLAGLKVTVGGVTYDGTLKAQLQKIKNQILTGFSQRN